MAFSYSPFTRSTDTRVRRYIKARNVFRADERVIVGISGGPDSTALLILLNRIAGTLGIHLTAGHFDHRLRSAKEAAADQTFVEELCRDRGVELICGGGDVKKRAGSRKESIEESARNLRYSFLGSTAKAMGATGVVVGHTLDDRAETVLMHVIRGSGIEGLAAMPARSPWPFGDGPDIVRPLLELRREDTLRYCRESGIEARIDATNDLPIATRNRVRAELVPLLRTFNPRIDEALARLAESLEGDAAALGTLAGAEWERVSDRHGGSIRFERSLLAELPASIVARLIQRAARELGGESPSARQIEVVQAAIAGPPSQVSLPGGLVASFDRRWLTIGGGGEAAHQEH